MATACDVMHHWIMEQNRIAVLTPVERKSDLGEVAAEVERLLKEPVRGITREHRYAELEGESWGAFVSSMGG